MTGRLFALAAVLAALSANPAGAQPSYYAPCGEADLKGVWSLQSITADEPGVEEFYRAHPVEYFRFGKGGAYIYVAMDNELPNLAAVNASLDRADRGDGVSYVARVIDDQGTMVIYRDGRAFQAFRCVMQDHAMIWHEVPGNADVSRYQVPVR